MKRVNLFILGLGLLGMLGTGGNSPPILTVADDCQVSVDQDIEKLQSFGQLATFDVFTIAKASMLIFYPENQLDFNIKYVDLLKPDWDYPINNLTTKMAIYDYNTILDNYLGSEYEITETEIHLKPYGFGRQNQENTWYVYQIGYFNSEISLT